MSDATPNVLSIAGALTMATAETWLARGREPLRAGDLIVDFSGVTEADSAALALLLDWMRTAESTGRKLSHRGMPAGMRSLAQLYGVDELLVGQA